MDYAQFEFKNKPTIEEILSYKNLYISGAVGSGKSVLLHQIVDEIIAKNDLEKLSLYIHDPKKFEFYIREKYRQVAKFVIDSNEQEFIAFLTSEIARRKLLSVAELENEKTIIIVSDDICLSDLEKFLMSVYSQTAKLKILLIIANQQTNAYIRYKSVLDSGKVFFITYPDGYDHPRTIVFNK